MNKLRLKDTTVRLFQGWDVLGAGAGAGQPGLWPTPEDPPLVIVDLVPKARSVGHSQLELHAFLLDDCGGERREEGIGLGGTG